MIKSINGLTNDVKKQLKKKGFLVLENISVFSFIKTLLSIPFIVGTIHGLLSLITLIILINFELNISFDPFEYISYISIAIFFLFFTYSLYYYSTSSNIFYSERGLIGSGIIDDTDKINSHNKKIGVYGNIFGTYLKALGYIGDIGFGATKQGLLLVAGFIVSGIYGLYSIAEKLGFLVNIDNFDFTALGGLYIVQFFSIFTYSIAFFLLGVFGKFLINSLHPLYAFGNLGSRIQSLTPRISETSEKIEKEFSTEMNFRTLSHSFDTLSKDFSEISSYVIKLETIEQKANKGNLFDSEKYIGSLREDIVKPLTTLRSFLEKKKTELQSSQEEMKKVRVKVGGSGNGETENLELQSKRSEPLREELTENIAKLGVMIEKFGKI